MHVPQFGLSSQQSGEIFPLFGKFINSIILTPSFFDLDKIKFFLHVKRTLAANIVLAM